MSHSFHFNWWMCCPPLNPAGKCFYDCLLIKWTWMGISFYLAIVLICVKFILWSFGIFNQWANWRSCLLSTWFLVLRKICRYLFPFSADGNYEVVWRPNLLLHYDGSILWMPPAVYESSCAIDVEYFPFDEQECEMKFGSWAFDATKVRGLSISDMSFIDSRLTRSALVVALVKHHKINCLKSTLILHLKGYTCLTR